MAARIARSLETLRRQANAIAPNRSKVSDGWIGDQAHRARKSDHNPDKSGIVRALDLTHDPHDDPNVAGDHLNADALINTLVAANDKRLKYLIWNRRIWQRDKAGNLVPKRYTGSNPHDKHGHVSVVAGAPGDDPAEWDLSQYGAAVPTTPAPLAVPNPYAKQPLLRRGSSQKEAVKGLQQQLNDLGAVPPLTVDGDFGPATFNAVVAFQKRAGIGADGTVGQYTWEAIDRARAQPQPAPDAPAVDNPTFAMQRFQQNHGWPKIHAAAFTGRAQQEAHPDIRTGALGDDDTAFGGWQWRKERRANVYDFADARGVLRTDWPTQIDFVPHELATDNYEKNRAGKMLKTADTLEKAVAAAVAYCRPRGFKWVDPDKHGWPAAIAAAKKGHGWANTLKNAQALMAK